MAFGPLALTHESFGQVTPREFNDLLAGWELKRKHDERLVAWAVSHLMNVSGNLKKPVTVDELLKRPGEQTETPDRDLRAEKEELKRRFEIS